MKLSKGWDEGVVRLFYGAGFYSLRHGTEASFGCRATSLGEGGKGKRVQRFRSQSMGGMPLDSR